MTLPAAVTGALDLLRTPEGWLTASSTAGRFASLFGRDSLIAALQLLPHDPSVAVATLERLGRELGTVEDPETEEEPGRVVHEARDGGLDAYVAHGWPVRDGRLRYYGTIDANAWFLVVLGSLARHGHDVRRHAGAGRRVADWLVRRPMPLAYRRTATSGGLAHQGWRDAAWSAPRRGHGVAGEDGRPLLPPVALAQVQALAWRALREAAEVLDPAYATAAERARAAFVATFLTGDVPAFAHHGSGLDRSATTDLGHILWTGILDGDRAAAATGERLVAEDLWTPFGLRTLSSAHAAFCVDGYHMGTVWPFDSWLCAGGLDAVGSGGDAVRAGIVAAVDRLGGFPELYVVELDGTLRASDESCSVQAWTVGALAAVHLGWDGRAWAA